MPRVWRTAGATIPSRVPSHDRKRNHRRGVADVFKPHDAFPDQIDLKLVLTGAGRGNHGHPDHAVAAGIERCREPSARIVMLQKMVGQSENTFTGGEGLGRSILNLNFDIDMLPGTSANTLDSRREQGSNTACT